MVLALGLLWSNPLPLQAEQTGPAWLRENNQAVAHIDILVATDWLAARLDRADLVVVDTRDRDDYLRGHIPGALHVPMESLLRQSDPRPVLGHQGLSPELHVVCYGDRSSFVATCHLFWLLELAGASRVHVLDGGVTAWQRAGHPLSGNSPPVKGRHWFALLDSSRLATIPYLHERLDDRDLEILDARAAGLQTTQAAMETPGSPWRAGHIPNALPVDFLAWLGEDETLPPPKEIGRLLSRVGPRAHTNVNLDATFAVYDDGRSGAGARGYLLLRLAGIPEVRYFPGGWSRWSQDPSLPVVSIVTTEEVRDLLVSAESPATPGAPRPGLVILDVRPFRDFEAGHLPGAVSLPSHQFRDSLTTILERHWPDCDPAQTPLMVYCYGPECIRSRICSTILAGRDFFTLYWYRGGIRRWREAGEAVISSSATE